QTSSTRSGTSIAKLQDGNYWYMQNPPNRWESAASETVTIEAQFGLPRQIQSIDLLFLDDSIETLGHGQIADISKAQVVVPKRVKLEGYREGKWELIEERSKENLRGKHPTKFSVASQSFEKVRIELQPQEGKRLGLTEIEAWGVGESPYRLASMPSGNLAYRGPGKEYPKASASHSDRFGGTPEKSNDGKTVFDPNPLNRWTSYESPQSEDWLELDLGQPRTFGRLELAIYDDRGGVQAPEAYRVEVWQEGKWVGVEDEVHRPEKPAGSQWNQATFKSVTSSKVRVVFRHKLPAKSGVTEWMLWEE
ncbi:MAG: discoidin domain-containing protein, partial [Pirellula sp.]